MSTRGRTALKAVVALVAASTLTVAGGWLSSAAFLGWHHNNPGRARIDSLPRYWQQYADDARYRKPLITCTLLGFGLAWGLPLAAVLAHRPRRPLHGDARWATGAEIRAAGLMGEQGLIVGKYEGRYLMFAGQQYVMVDAPPRSGKGVSFVIPNLLNWSGSAVVLDIKGEACAATSRYRADHGHSVFVFAPFDEQAMTHRWNPLASVRMDEHLRVGDLLRVGQSIYQHAAGNDAQAEHAAFFSDQARNLFVGLGLYLLETPERPRTFGEMLRLASGDLAALVRERQKTPRPLSGACVAALNRYLSSPEQTAGSILATFNAPLLSFADPITDVATSQSDFDLADVRKQRMTVYLVVPFEKLGPTARVLMNLFFSELIALNTRVRPEEDEVLQHQCLVVLDEFTAAGRIDILARAIGFLPGYNLRLITIAQSESQKIAVYGPHTAQAMATAHAMRVLFAPKEVADADTYSKMLGTCTEMVTTRGGSHSHSARGGSSSRSHNESPRERRLMLPQELREMPLREQIIVLEGCRPIRCHKAWYLDDEVFLQRLWGAVVPPKLEVQLHMARVEGRMRSMTDEDDPAEIDPGRIVTAKVALDLSLDATDEQVDRLLDGFLGEMVPGEAADTAGGDGGAARQGSPSTLQTGGNTVDAETGEIVAPASRRGPRAQVRE